MSEESEVKLDTHRMSLPPDRYTKKALALILEKAQEWKCSPADAEARLLDELAERQERKGAARCFLN